MAVAACVADSLTVIVFTRDESGKVEALVSGLETVLDGSDPEIFIVVERRQATPDEIWSTVMTASRAVRSIDHPSRTTESARPTAVVAEPAPARDDWVVVMDGDRPHPAELVPALVRAGQRARADIVVATDTGERGAVAGSSSPSAPDRVASGADRLAHQLIPSGHVTAASDPMRGFFAVRRDSVTDDVLSPRRPGLVGGALDRRRHLSITELPEVGRPLDDPSPHQPERRLSQPAVETDPAAQTVETGRRWRSVARAVGFAVVGATGLAVNSIALWAFVDVLGLGLLLSATLATQVSTAWNFLLIDALVFRGPKTRSTWPRFIGFAVVNNVVLLLRLPLLSWLVFTVGTPYLAANILSLIAAFAARFFISDRYLFGTRSSDDNDAREADLDRGIDGRHAALGPSDVRAADDPWAPGGTRDRPDASGLAVPA